MPEAVAVVTIMFTDTALVTTMSVGTMAAVVEKYGAARHNAASGADANTMTMVTTIIRQAITDKERQRRLAILNVGARSDCDTSFQSQ